MSSAKMVSGFVASVSKLAYHTLSISTNQSIDLQISLLKQKDLQATNTLLHIKYRRKGKTNYTYLKYIVENRRNTKFVATQFLVFLSSLIADKHNVSTFHTLFPHRVSLYHSCNPTLLENKFRALYFGVHKRLTVIFY